MKRTKTKLLRTLFVTALIMSWKALQQRDTRSQIQRKEHL